MKTYFNYEGQIGSKEVAEAIAFPIGIGPFMGFGSADISGGKVTIYPEAPSSSPYNSSVKDRNQARNLALSGETSKPTHGLINRTGHIWVSTQNNITIDNIRGSQGGFNEVLVFAVFQNIESPVLNKPTFLAYWNSSQISFYEYWKKSIDPSYGSSGESPDPWNSEISFDDLISKAATVVNVFENSSTMVLIGIYGTGVEAETGNNENFALVPYSGEFPQSIPFSLDYYNTLKNAIKKVTDFAFTGLEGYENIKSYIDKMLGKDESTGDVAGIVPVGGIIAWSGATVPEGWALCNGMQGTPDLQGKFILGFGDGKKMGDTGGNANATLTTNNLPAHKHEFKDYYFPEDAGSLSDATYKESLGSYNNKAGSKGNDRNNDMVLYKVHDTENAGQLSPTPIDIMPPYYVLAYIMRIK